MLIDHNAGTQQFFFEFDASADCLYLSSHRQLSLPLPSVIYYSGGGLLIGNVVAAAAFGHRVSVIGPRPTGKVSDRPGRPFYSDGLAPGSP